MLASQVQGYTEHFTDSCDGPIGWIASSTLYLAFSEGWALYAENPLIPKHTKMYQVDPISKYGMLKWQVPIAKKYIANGLNQEYQQFVLFNHMGQCSSEKSNRHLSLKKTSAQVVETSVNANKNYSFQNQTNPDDHTIQTNKYTVNLIRLRWYRYHDVMPASKHYQCP